MKEAATNPEAWVDRHGDVMFRYALVRVGRREVAEDLVQDALLAALSARQPFRGDSAERTWLIGILRHKILDHLRSRSRGMAGLTEDGGGAWLNEGFDARGWRIKPPRAGANDEAPEALLERQEFWVVFDRCMDDLPPRAREAFARRVMEGEDAKVICEAMDVTTSNLWVILHRARGLLQHCLERMWFDRQAVSEKQQT